MLIVSDRLNEIALTPSIAKDENIVCSDSENNENCHLVQRGIHSDLEDARVDQIAHWETQQNHQHDKTGHKETLKVEPNAQENECSREGRERDVTCQDFLEEDVQDEVPKGFSLDCVIALIFTQR